VQKGPLLGQGRTAEVFAWGEFQVLKLFFTTWPVDWIHQEARVTRLVHEAGLASPAAGDIVEVEGRLGIVYERVDGPSMLEDVARHPWRVASLARQFTDLHLVMHRTTLEELPGGRELLTGLLRAAPRLGDEVKARLLGKLDRLPDQETICHGDYHPDNILMTRRGPIVIDWMSVTRGHPLADVAGTSLLFRVIDVPSTVGRLTRGLIEVLRRVFLSLYLRRYFGSSPHPRGQVDEWIPVMAAAYLGQGLTSREEARLISIIDAAL
jgi:aminoglycoside phosphotransferase (APT) family kinase protein